MPLSHKLNLQKNITYYAWLVSLLWTLLIGSFLAWNIKHEFDGAKQLALTTARANFFKDQSFRFWASQKGGIYVTPSYRTQPSPYLAHLKDRDLVANDGRKLTLMNPNFMMREIMEDYADLYGIKGRIVGIVTLNPKNRADPWEEKAIRAFAAGTTQEMVEESDIDGQPHLRMIRPMMMTEDCMKCHGHLGFKVGDVRGAVGIAVPLNEYTRQARSAAVNFSASLGGIWVLGLAGILITSNRTRIRFEEREKALDELQLSARAFQNGLQAVMITDADGVILRVNPMFSEITGFSAQDALGKTPKILRSGRHDTAFYRAFWEKLLQDDKWEGEFWNRRKNSEEYAVLENISTVRGPDGKLRYYIAMFQDITKRIENEAQIQQLNQELEKRVEKRTAELLTAKLEAERANHAKSDFLSSMSHELRTPMNAILGFSQLLKISSNLTKQESDNVDEVLNAGKHLLELINGILDLAKIEEGRLDITLETLSCLETSKECLDLLQPLKQRYQVSMQTQLPNTPIYVLADKIRLKQVLLNLLSNAFKYNRPQGTVTLRIEMIGQDTVRWSVEDTGIGIPPERQQELFQAFNRLGAEMLEVEGTGIGLAISKRLIEAMCGQIGFKSIYGIGSTFWFELPRSHAKP